MRRAQLLLPILCFAGCGPDLGSQMELAGYRVLGIEASPPEVRSDGAVALNVVDYYDGERPVNYRWSLCLHSYGVTDEYTCVEEDLEVALSEEREVAVDFGPAGIDLGSYLPALLEYPDPKGNPRSLATGFDVWVRLESGPDCRGCTIDTVKRLTVIDSDDKPNANPVVEAFDVASGTLRRGSTVTLEVTTDRPESFVSPDTGRETVEQYVYSWYTDGGETDPARTFGDEQRTELILPDRAGPVQVSVTVRDGRGGFASATRTLDVE